RTRAGDQVRDVRDHAHQGRDHRRAALAGLGAAVGALAGAGDREGQLQARAPPAARADGRGDGGGAEDHGAGVPGLAAADLQLDDRGARRAVDGVGLLGRPDLAAGHHPGPRRAGPGRGDGPDRAQGPRGGRDLAPARAREARGGAVLLREPDPARDRGGPRRHRVADLPAAHQGRPAAALAADRRRGV
ncbi:MAG: RNA polymerase sigma factor for flagellar operon, partial [uncultured Solirubrobacteraceae bacterium]